MLIEDFKQLITDHPNATYFVRLLSTGLIDAGYCYGDIIAIDTACEEESGDTVLARIGAELALCRWEPPRLVPLDEKWKDMSFTLNAASKIVGVVVSFTRRMRPQRKGRTIHTHQQ